MCTVTCPRCGTENRFTGFTEMLAYTCRKCGNPVKCPDLGISI
jgi:hypothetical protein